MLVMNEDYEIAEKTYSYKGKDDLFAVLLKHEPFNGIVYTYGTIDVADEENPDGTFSISFDYEIREGKDRVTEENKTEFEKHISDVLESVIINSLELAEERYNNEVRNQDSKAFDRE